MGTARPVHPSAAVPGLAASHAPCSLGASASLAASLDGVGTGSLVVVTGAGVSFVSGIPTFREADHGAVCELTHASREL